MERVIYILKSSYIKDYDGGTLMEAYCNPIIDYSNLSEIIKKQKDVLKQKVSELLQVKKIRKYSELEKNVIKKHNQRV